MHWIASEGNRWLEVRIPFKAAGLDLHGVRQQDVHLAEVLSLAQPSGLAEAL